MRIAVLGAVCFDEIIPLEGDPRHSFGGILYNVAAVSSLLKDGDAVVPVSRLGEDRYEAARAEFAKLPHVDTCGLTRCPDPTTHVTLTWRNETWRDETILYRMPPFDMDTLSPALDCDVAHINFINGTEFDLETLKAFRAAFDGLLSLDVHQIISRFDAQGQREIVGFKQWRDWAPHVDLVQCNEYEAATMFDAPLESRPDYVAAARAICEAGPRAATITLGTEGALTVSRQGGDYYLADIPDLPKVDVVDTTGCGDSFSAGFLYGMHHFDNPGTALACGTLVAAVNAQHSGIEELTEAPALLAEPRSHFELFADKPEDWCGERL